MDTQSKHQPSLLWRTAMAVLALVLGAAACQAGAPATAPTETSLPPTAAPTNTPAPTDTPIPTATPLPTDTPTPEPSPTSTPDLKATEAAQATATMDAMVADVQKKFADYKLTVNEGYLAWVQTQKLPIDLDQYGQKLFYPLDENLSFSDFILHTDIMWKSSGGLAGCGLMFRSEENFSRGAQYEFATLRLSGYPAWDFEYWNFGQFQTNISGKVQSSKAIDLDQEAVNEYLIVAKGSTLTAYANGTKIGTASNSKLSEGLIAFLAFQNSGTTTCEFDNTWVWALK